MKLSSLWLVVGTTTIYPTSLNCFTHAELEPSLKVPDAETNEDTFLGKHKDSSREDDHYNKNQEASQVRSSAMVIDADLQNQTVVVATRTDGSLNSAEDIMEESLPNYLPMEKRRTNKMKNKCKTPNCNVVKHTKTGRNGINGGGTKKPPYPVVCEDEPDWRMPSDSIWRNSGLENKTCDELKTLSSPAKNYKDWCEFLSQGIVSSKSPMEACCFCGGGDDVPEQCEDIPGWSMLAGSNIDCDFIGHVENPAALCETMANATFSSNGISTSEACCVCGGGTRSPTPAFPPSTITRRMQADEDPTEPPQVDLRDWTTRTGLGESPGVPNLEFLGTGYHGFLGNPRGSDNSEVDPGFRRRVIRLVQQQDTLTIDQEFTVPLGTDLKYTSSCKYDYQSTEISSETDFRQSLGGEAQFATSSTRSSSRTTTIGINLWWFSASRSETTSFSESQAFSMSSKYQAFTSASQRATFVNFESKAICSEYEAAFSPYAEQELDPDFKTALDSLPFPYDPENSLHATAYSNFISIYGTHYTKQVVLGAKRIHTTSISSREYGQLVSERVDVANTLSYETATAIGSSTAFNTASAKQLGQALAAAAPLVAPPGVGTALSSAISVAVESAPEEKSSDIGDETKEQSSNSLELFTSSSRQAESARKIQATNKRITEVNVGGLPNQDWREWAKTVKDKPMPISYELEPLIELMGYQQSLAYTEAVFDLFDIDIILDARNELLRKGGIKLGISRPSGQPIDPSSQQPESSAILQVSTQLRNYTSLVYDRETFSYRNEIRGANVTTYASTWKNKDDRIRPIFATVFNQGVGPNTIEEESPSTVDLCLDILDAVNYFPIALCSDTSSACEFAMTNFGIPLESYNMNLRNFNFLVIDNIARSDSDDFVSGVVSYDTVVLNQEGGGNGTVEVKQTSFVGLSPLGQIYSSRAFNVSNLPSNWTEPPTIVVFPYVFDDTYPSRITSVNLFVGDMTSNSFSVKRTNEGKSDGTFDKVGFSFLAFDVNFKSPNILHGFIDVGLGNTTSSRLSGIRSVEKEVTVEEDMIDVDYIYDVGFGRVRNETTTILADRGGFRLTFEKEFDKLPTVIATPVDTAASSSPFCSSGRHCVVETTTVKDCFVKCLCYYDHPSERSAVALVPFNIVIIGPEKK